jgi:hypothetical protein
MKLTSVAFLLRNQNRLQKIVGDPDGGVRISPLAPENKRRTMSKVNPYHTNSTEYPPEHRNVYHDHDNCEDGKRIQQQHREFGTGGKPRCKVCIRLG